MIQRFRLILSSNQPAVDDPALCDFGTVVCGIRYPRLHLIGCCPAFLVPSATLSATASLVNWREMPYEVLYSRDKPDR
jgi:hypothetical protein